MVEWLAMPASDTEPITLDAWSEAFLALGHGARIVHDGPGVAWIEVASQRLRGYVVIEEGFVEAINFELSEPDSGLPLLQSIVAKLGWELYQEDDDEDDSP